MQGIYAYRRKIAHARHLRTGLAASRNRRHSCCGAGLLLRKWREAEIWLDNAQVGEDFLGLVRLDGWVNNHVVTWDPVDRGCDLVLVAGLERVEDAEDLGRVATGRGRVGQDRADGLLGVDEEDGADGECLHVLMSAQSTIHIQCKRRRFAHTIPLESTLVAS